MIDFGLADFREVFGAGYVTGKRTLIHNEPHHVQPPQQADSKSQANGQQEEVQGGGTAGGPRNKGTKFFPNPSNLLPKVSFGKGYCLPSWHNEA